jgi:hypothetical protein
MGSTLFHKVQPYKVIPYLWIPTLHSEKLKNAPIADWRRYCKVQTNYTRLQEFAICDTAVQIIIYPNFMHANPLKYFKHLHFGNVSSEAAMKEFITKFKVRCKNSSNETATVWKNAHASGVIFLYTFSNVIKSKWLNEPFINV